MVPSPRASLTPLLVGGLLLLATGCAATRQAVTVDDLRRAIQGAWPKRSLCYNAWIASPNGPGQPGLVCEYQYEEQRGPARAQ